MGKTDPAGIFGARQVRQDSSGKTSPARGSRSRRLTDEVASPNYLIFAPEVTSCWIDWEFVVEAEDGGKQTYVACDQYLWVAILNVLIFYALWVYSIKFLVLCTQ